jgi:hypothetical protein
MYPDRYSRYERAHLATSLVRAPRHAGGDDLPLVDFAMYGDGLNKQLIFFCSPRCACMRHFYTQDRFRAPLNGGDQNRVADSWRRSRGKELELRLLRHTRLDLVHRPAQSESRRAMSLMNDVYSSDEEAASGDVFGLSKLPATKKARVATPEPSAMTVAAPDVLSEVRAVPSARSML